MYELWEKQKCQEYKAAGVFKDVHRENKGVVAVYSS